MATFFDSGVYYDALRQEAGVADDGSFAFAADTTAPTSSDYIVARWTPEGGFALMAREGVQAPGQPPGVGYGGNAGDVHMLDDGLVAFGSGGLTGSGDNAAFINSAINDGEVLFQDGVTVPENQTGVPPAPLWFPYSFRIDATGQNYIYAARLMNGHNVVVVNNRVVADRDMPLPGGYPGFFDDGDEAGERVSSYNGHYAFRCPADFVVDSGHVVAVDEEVVAASDAPIMPGSAEYWFNSGGFTPFAFNIVNSNGDYVVGGGSNGPNGQDGVMVFNRSVVLVRTGDPVDLNGDGLSNDGAYLRNIRDSGFLTEDGRLYFCALLQNAGQQQIGEAFMWLPVPRGGDINCDGAIDFFDIDPFLLALFDEPGYAAAYPDCWRITADINRDGDVNFFDIDPFIACLFDACP